MDDRTLSVYEGYERPENDPLDLGNSLQNTKRLRVYKNMRITSPGVQLLASTCTCGSPRHRMVEVFVMTS